MKKKNSKYDGNDGLVNKACKAGNFYEELRQRVEISMVGVSHRSRCSNYFFRNASWTCLDLRKFTVIDFLKECWAPIYIIHYAEK